MRRHALAFLTAVSLAAASAPSVLADKGDKAGWSLDTDPRKRAFLIFVPVKDGPRLLTLGCLRDVDSFTVLSQQDPGVPSGQGISLTLANGAAKYVVLGKFDPDGAGVGQPGFDAEFDADKKALVAIGAQLLPVLQGKGPIVLTVGSKTGELPIDGLSKSLARFKSVCFG